MKVTSILLLCLLVATLADVISVPWYTYKVVPGTGEGKKAEKRPCAVHGDNYETHVEQCEPAGYECKNDPTFTGKEFCKVLKVQLWQKRKPVGDLCTINDEWNSLKCAPGSSGNKIWQMPTTPDKWTEDKNCEVGNYWDLAQ